MRSLSSELRLSLPICRCPPNFPLRAEPIPCSSLLSVARRGPHRDKLFRFGSCTIMSRISGTVIESAEMVKEVGDFGNPTSQGIHEVWCVSFSTTTIFFRFANPLMRPKNSRGGASSRWTKRIRCNSLTWWAGLCSRTGNTRSHLDISCRLK